MCEIFIVFYGIERTCCSVEFNDYPLLSEVDENCTVTFDELIQKIGIGDFQQFDITSFTLEIGLNLKMGR